jgi:hypothetical protein
MAAVEAIPVLVRLLPIACLKNPADCLKSANKADDGLPAWSTGILKPAVKDPDLEKIVNDLYRSNAVYGSGSTADAIRYTLQTGQLIGDSDHWQKGGESITRLYKWLAEHPGALPEDVDAVQMLANDLLHGLGH